MIEATNIFSATVEGRIDLAAAAGSTDTAAFLYDIEPGAASCPYHYEMVEEWLLVVEGTVSIRTPEGERTLQRGDLARFPAGAAGAHKISNRGETRARTLLLSSTSAPAVSVYPDSGKVGLWTGDPADGDLIFLRESVVEWSHGEEGWNVAD